MSTKLDLDLRFDRVDLSESFNNFIVITKSGFTSVRVGFKASATTLNVSLEGRFIGAGFQTAALTLRKYKVFR